MLARAPRARTDPRVRHVGAQGPRRSRAGAPQAVADSLADWCKRAEPRHAMDERVVAAGMGLEGAGEALGRRVGPRNGPARVAKVVGLPCTRDNNKPRA